MIFLLANNNEVYGQDSIRLAVPDTSQILKSKDTTKISPKNKKSEIEDPVKYSAKDSFTFDMPNKKIYLYGDAVVTYQNIELKANYIEFNMTDETVYAVGTPDSSGTIIGKPEFKEGSETFKADWLRYNFKTKKGFINVVITKPPGAEGTLIGDSTKRIANGDIFLKGGKYSTCDLPHPHFYLALTKAKAVPNDKIVSGPAYLVLADIPLPLILPFGFFPNTKGIRSGLLAPNWGQERNGYYLRDGGYYFAFNDYLNATLRGNIYSNGSWGARTLLTYKKRYKFSGNFDFQYNVTVTGEKGLLGYSKDKDYGISWTHNQDPKANPNNQFSASVRIASRLNDKRNSYVTQDYLSTSKSSSINFAHRWPNSPFSFNASFTHSQNNRTKTVDMTLPQMSFEMNPIKPFMGDDVPLKPKWYQKIEIRYDARLTNNVSTYDSLLFTKHTFDDINNGFQHEFRPNINFRLHELTNTSLTPSISYEGVLFTKEQTLAWDSVRNKVDIIGLNKGLYYAHAIKPSISLGTSPMFFGMYTFRNSKIKAIRHTISPQISFNATPDIRSFWPDYYRSYIRNGKKVPYPKYIGTYSTPIPASGKSASISFGLNNRLEMKYLSVNDTASAEKKVNLLDHFNISGSYDLIADSNNLSNISMSASTNLFKKFDISFSSSLDPYAVDSLGNRLRYFEWSNSYHKRLARMTNASVTISTDFGSQGGDKGNQSQNPQNTPPNISEAGASTPTNATDINYNIPWTLRLNYTWGFSGWGKRRTIDHSVGFSGSLAVTKKWNVTYSSNYDFVGKDLGFTNISINRDLHCWQMSFHWVPFGYAARYNFTINVKASILSDLKYTKQSDSRRNY